MEIEGERTDQEIEVGIGAKRQKGERKKWREKAASLVCAPTVMDGCISVSCLPRHESKVK